MKSDISAKVARMNEACLCLKLNEEWLKAPKLAISECNDFEASYLPSSQLSHDDPLRVWMWDLFCENMKNRYISSSWEWNEDEKKSELNDSLNRYLIIKKKKAGIHVPVAYLSFRIVEENCLQDEESIDAIYCFELQISTEYRRLGIGSYLMGIFEEIGKELQSSKAMLTVFQSNSEAVKFYEKIGYLPDEISPSQCLKPDLAKQYDWEIMSKKLI